MKNLIIILFVFGLFSCSNNEKTPDRPNILWISHEDLSPIYGCYGDEYANTPNIDALAESGYLFTKAFSNAPICAPARSTLITGIYAPSTGTQHLRSEIPVPENLKILPEILREAGYYTTNNSKTDYNFDYEGRWDESSGEAHWRKRPEGKPFFSVFNFGITHEGSTNSLNKSSTEKLKTLHDPEKAQLPPFFPDSPLMRETWAHMYDLLSVFDNNVAELVQQLKEDGVYDNTIIFVFSDHGSGLPGFKRWLNNAGLQVPFVLHVPEKYRHLVGNLTPRTEQMVGFVDFAPTVLTLAGIEVPEMMEGQNFVGNQSEPKKYIYGYRDRADDCYDVARSVYDGRYIYIRHFMPQIPYFQNAVIFQKDGTYKEIHRLKKEGKLPDATLAWFEEKPVEQLFDLQNDPWEQNNQINNEELSSIAETLRGKVNEWILKHHDTGMINEGIMMTKAKKQNTSVYEMARAYSDEDFSKIVDAAQMVGKVENPKQLVPYLESDDSAVRFWALEALDAYKGDISVVVKQLDELLNDQSLSVAAKAAEIKVKRYNDQNALKVLGEILKSDYEPVVLQAAISIRYVGAKAEPLIPVIQNEVMPKYSGDIWGRYKTWSYPMFIGMALDQTQINCGVDLELPK